MPRGTALTHQDPADISRDNKPLVYILDLPTKKTPDTKSRASWEEKARY